MDRFEVGDIITRKFQELESITIVTNTLGEKSAYGHSIRLYDGTLTGFEVHEYLYDASDYTLLRRTPQAEEIAA